MKIFALPSHQEKHRTHGVDYARIISPMKNLNGYKGIETFVYDPKIEELHNNHLEWKPIAEKYDIIYFNYLHNPWGFAAMGSMARGHGVKLVLDMDDDLWDVHTDNPAYKTWQRGGENIRNFTSICNEVDYITCTSDYLKHVIMSKTNKRAEQIKVFPNYIDLNVYKFRSPFKDDGEIRLTHFGSSSHWLDLEDNQFFKGVDRIMKEYPNVKFRTVGTWIPRFRSTWGSRFEIVYGHQDIYEWIRGRFREFMGETDILVTPLVDDVYNRCKSSIKWLEAGSAKIPGVWENIRQYAEVVDGTNGMLAKTDSEWYKSIKYLIDNPDIRKRMGQSTFKDIENKWQIKDHLEDYRTFFKELLDK